MEGTFKTNLLLLHEPKGVQVWLTGLRVAIVRSHSPREDQAPLLTLDGQSHVRDMDPMIKLRTGSG